MKTYYPAKQVVSIWVGNFLTEDDFDKCVNSEVSRRLALKTPIESICEIAFEKTPVPVRQLIEGFSGWETFAVQAENASIMRGVQLVNAALVCYYVKCEDAPELWGDLHFLGSFAGQDVG